MPFIVDASMAAAWILPDEKSEAADQVLQRLLTHKALVPSLFWHEVRNLVLNAEQRGRIARGDAIMAIDHLRHLPIDDAGAGPDGGVLSLAIAYRLSAYDAVYLWLSISQSMPLATLDRLLAAAACAEHVEILGPLAP